MDKGKIVIISLALGLIFMSFLDFKLPIYISVGMTTFVTFLTLNDFASTAFHRFKQIENSDDKFIIATKNFLARLANFNSDFLKKITDILLYFSVPFSIYTSYITKDLISEEELLSYQQSLTLYTLGLVVFLLAKNKEDTVVEK
ncbi:hypothetical protein [Planomicrobium sp. Y74]|uniref:hypothetical protein n=1 Tax=Planomicrobium sp. Y74 TaxID=2478977 RepID=UPI000EF47378|nr:hypothetical protein [Planomicrobium sp. Y74]RLQ92120.1 hypothetical protein D9754_04870 [Planomicrobium sp. Y74]